MIAHHKTSPYVIEGRKKALENRKHGDGNKLTMTQVMFIKKKLLDPNQKARLKILARQFGVSEMTLYRIKTGENWRYVEV